MNIIREDIDELNALIKVKVEEADYLPKVESLLKEYQKKDRTPGFRPGNIPIGLIRKRIGTRIKADEIQNVLNDSLTNYLEKGDVEIVGNPIPSSRQTGEIDWVNQKDFEFLYDMGLAPKFNIDISSGIKMVYQKIKVKDELVDTQVNAIATRYGKVSATEISTHKDRMSGKFAELDSNGELLEAGIATSGSLYIPRIKDETTKKMLTGVKVGDKVIVDSQLLSDTKTDLAAMLNIEKEVAENLTSKFQFTVENITGMIPAELNQEFFDKVVGPGEVTNESEFRALIKTDLEKRYEADSDHKFYNDAVAHLIKTTNFELPDEFLKRYMKIIASETNGKMSIEDVESNYPKYQEGYKWQMIENKIVKDNNLSVNQEELFEFSKEYIVEQYMRYGVQLTEEMFEKAIKELFSNEKEIKNIRDILFVKKMTELFKSKFTLQIEEVDYDDFFNVKN